MAWSSDTVTKGTSEYGNINRFQGEKESYDEICYNGGTIRREVVEASRVGNF